MTSGAQIRVRFCTLMSLLPSEDVCEEKFTDVEDFILVRVGCQKSRNLPRVSAGIDRE